MTTPTVNREMTTTPVWHRRWVWDGALVALLLLAVLLYNGLPALRSLTIGHTLTTAAKAQTIRLN